MPEPSKGKRRRGSQHAATRGGRRRANRSAAARLDGIPGCPGWSAARSSWRSWSGSRPASAAAVAEAAAASARPGASAATGSCPTSQPPALPAGETRTVTLDTAEGRDRHQGRGRPVADRGRQLRGAGVVRLLRRHGLPPDGRRSRTGRRSSSRAATRRARDGGPATRSRTSRSRRRTSAARSRWRGPSQPNTVGSQFFIVLDDKDGAVLASYNTYQIIGNVTSGMETADAIFAASGGVGAPGRTRSRSRPRPSPTPEPHQSRGATPMTSATIATEHRRHRGRAVRRERPEGGRELHRARPQGLLRRRRLPPRHPGLRRPGRRRPVRQEVVARARARRDRRTRLQVRGRAGPGRLRPRRAGDGQRRARTRTAASSSSATRT